MALTLDHINALLEDAHNRESFHHGEKHWRGVAQAGWYLAAHDSRVDAEVVLAFAVLHDSRRENEFEDPDHGVRAANRAHDLWMRGRLPVEVFQMGVLCHALDIHNGAVPADVTNPTVAACLDADRLNLWRVGHKPDPALLCTDYARRPNVIRWAERLCESYCPTFKASWRVITGQDHRLIEPLPLLTWAQLAAVYAELERRPIRKLLAFGHRYGAGALTAR